MDLHQKKSKLIIILFVVTVIYCITTGCVESQNLSQEDYIVPTGETSTTPEELNQAPQTEPVSTISIPQDIIHYQKGLEFFNQSRYHEAIDEFSAALALNSTNYDALYYRARSNYQLGYNLSYEYRGREEFQKAIDDFTGVINNSPSADAYSWRGKSKIELGRIIHSLRLINFKKGYEHYQDGLDDFSHALSIDPNFSDALTGRSSASYFVGIGQGYKQAGYIPVNEALLDSGRKDVVKALKLNQSDPEANHIQAWYHYYDGNYKEARIFIDRAIEAEPDEAYYYFDRAKIKRGSDDRYGAIEDLSKAIELQPRYSNAYNFRGILKDWTKQSPESIISDYDKAIEINPEIPPYYDNYIWALIRLKAGYKSTFEDAILLADKAIELDPLDPEYHLSRGYLLTWLDRGYEACEEFNIYKEYSNTNEAIELADNLMFAWSNYHAIEDYGYFFK